VSEFVIRRATPADAGGMVALARAVGSEPGRWLLTSSDWRSAAHERRYLRSIRRSARAAVFVAEAREGIVGRLSLARDPHPSSLHVADLGLMVAHSHRRRGVGTALLEQAVDWAREVGVSKLELHVFPHNEPALALYESFGFEREGYRRGQFLRAGELLDAILMAYEVPPTLPE
jgi:RimJ/RimL family protein N-acetyltransferase